MGPAGLSRVSPGPLPDFLFFLTLPRLQEASCEPMLPPTFAPSPPPKYFPIWSLVLHSISWKSLWCHHITKDARMPHTCTGNFLCNLTLFLRAPNTTWHPVTLLSITLCIWQKRTPGIWGLSATVQPHCHCLEQGLGHRTNSEREGPDSNDPSLLWEPSLSLLNRSETEDPEQTGFQK